MNVSLPFSIDREGRTATVPLDRHVRNLIEQVLFTNPGERVNRWDFGSGLLGLVFSPNSAELAAALQANVHAALQRWLGDLIEVRNLEVASVDAELRILLEYAVVATGEERSEVFERTIT